MRVHSGRRRSPRTCPARSPRFVGREDEIDRVRDDLLASRIVTLAGPGGSGKTRLALAVAADIRDVFPHGVWFVDLAALRDPALLEPAVAVALGVRETPDRTASEALRAHLRERTVLLVLDNLEQLLPAAAGIVAATGPGRPRPAGAGDQPRAAARSPANAGTRSRRLTAKRPSHCSSTARERNGRTSPPRVSHSPRSGRSADAWTAFPWRSSSRRPGSGCSVPSRSSNGSAAASTWGPDRATRPNASARCAAPSTGATSCCPSSERRLFARLAVFAGSWTPDMAAAVADPDDDLGIDLVAGLESLADKSLVRVEPA